MLDTIDIVVRDDEHVEATVKTRSHVRQVLEYAKAHNIKYYRGVTASTGKTYNENGDCDKEWYENPDYVEPTPVVEEEPVPEDVPLVEDPLEPEAELTETAVEAETEPEVDYKAMYEAVVIELQNTQAEVAARDEHIRKLEEDIKALEKTNDDNDEDFGELQEKYDELKGALALVGGFLRGEN